MMTVTVTMQVGGRAQANLKIEGFTIQDKVVLDILHELVQDMRRASAKADAAYKTYLGAAPMPTVYKQPLAPMDAADDLLDEDTAGQIPPQTL